MTNDQNQPQKEETPTPAEAEKSPSLEPTPETQLSEQTPPVIDKAKPKKKVSLVFILALILLLVAAFLAFWALRKTQKPLAPAPSPQVSPEPTPAEDELLNQLEEQSPSDEIEAIEEDVKNTDLTNLDQELTEIENELSLP